jgi:hypothetical protein
LRFFREFKRGPGNEEVEQRKMWGFHVSDCCHDQLL